MMLSWSLWANNAQEITCAMLVHVNRQLFFAKITYTMFLYIWLGQHCVGILYTQCFPSIYICLRQHYIYKKITYAMLAQTHRHCFWKKITYPMLPWSAWANIAQDKYLCNVGPQSINNFSLENNTQIFSGSVWAKIA